ncbi:PQQ-binding-like beta-propeller repeat protein [Actinoplanes sp. CA-252034]|uniref:outer membrane protein assembly factor BamB family protein n=1 Tax=Actinoplanes sp. CA-252034 TaxID=3239906 RepID=UPI003D9959D0
MTMSVIDLGDVSRLPDEPEDHPDGRRAFERFRVRRPAKAVIAVLAVLALGGSALPGPPVLHEVWSAPLSEAESMTVDGDALYVNRTRGTGTEITAYELGTGVVRWRRPVDTGPAWLSVTPHGDVLLLPGDEQSIDVTSDDGATVSYSYSGSLTALDRATGAPLWKRPGAPHWQDTGDTLLMYERTPTGTMTWLRLIRTGDGSVVWERRAPEKSDIVMVQLDGDTPARVVTATPQGDLTVLRYADGAPVTSGSVPWQPTSYTTGAGSSLTTVGGRLVVIDTGLGTSGDRSRVTVYRTDELVPLWSRDTKGWANVQDCGPLACVNTLPGSFEAVDPETGEKRWEMPGGQFIGSVPGGERVLIAGTDDKPQQSLVDAATGRVIGPGGNGSLLSLDEEEGTAMLLRALDQATGAVSRLDTTTGRSTLLGRIAAGDQLFCSAQGRWIACSLGDRLVVSTAG